VLGSGKKGAPSVIIGFYIGKSYFVKTSQ